MPQTATPLLDAFSFDLTRSMTITYSGTATSHPVQNGAEGVTDMIVIDPAAVSISGVTANTPAIARAGFSGRLLAVLAVNTDRMITLTDLIVSMHEMKLRCTVYCAWHKPLFDYWPGTVGLTRDQSSGNTIPTTLTFTKIRTVNSMTIPTMQDSDVLALAQSRVEFGPVAFE